MSLSRAAAALFSLLAISLALVAGRGAPPAGAASTVYVDNVGNCLGLTPCFHTLQAGVNNAGPAPAEVRVFPGAFEEGVDLNLMGSAIAEGPGDLALLTLAADGTPAPGTVDVDGGAKPAFRTTSTFPGSVSISGFTVMSAEEDGIRLVVRDDITIANVTASGVGDGVDEDDTGDDGVDARSTQGSIVITDTTANDNGDPAGPYNDGVDLKAPSGDVTLQRVTANGNMGFDDSDGVDVWETSGNVTITDSTANGNSTNGIVLTTQADVSISGTVTDENGNDGIEVYETGGAVTIEGSSATENGEDGFDVYDTAGAVTVTNGTTVGNGDDGADLFTDADIAVSGLTSLNNGLMNEFGGGLDTGGLGAASGDINVMDSRFQGNKKHGVDFFSPSAGGDHSLTGSVFCDNEAGGLFLSQDTGLSAEGNWWGADSGPTHPNNPGGTGQTVGDSDTGGAGEVDFTPWIDTVTATELPAPATAVESEPVAIGFQFTGGAGAVSLEEGPGDLNGAGAFVLTTDNGTLTSSQGEGPAVAEFIVAGQLTVTLTPDHEGTATVTAVGPCDLESDITIDVEAGTLHGDVDCDGDVDSVDALKVLRHVAGLGVTQTEPCPDIGADDPVFGDIDCDGDVDSVDSLRILRHVAGLATNLPPGCGPIGE